MFAYLLNSKFEVIKLIDTFESFIWTDRYREAGDFEIYTRPTVEILDSMKMDYYLINPDSEHTMYIEAIQITTDADEGSKVIISGHSLEKLLSRRIVIDPVTIDDTLQNGFKKIFNDAIISPKNPNRKIKNFIFKESSDPRITKIKMSAQYEHEDLYSIVKEQCELHDLGFKLILDDDNHFVFSFYKGIDRTYEQLNNPHVTFSPSFENISNSSYVKNNDNFANVVIVVGETDSYGRIVQEVGEASGISRCEVYSDGHSISDKREDESLILKNDYIALLKAQGTVDLEEHELKVMFDGEAEPMINYIYGVDYNIGDLVQVSNEFGMDAESIVSEMIWSHDADGIKSYPTFVYYDRTGRRTNDHSKLINRNLDNQHPIKSIIGLIDILDTKTTLQGFEWNSEIVEKTLSYTVSNISYGYSNIEINDHSKLMNRDLPNQHTINAISGLLGILRNKANKSVYEWNNTGSYSVKALTSSMINDYSEEGSNDHSKLFNRDIDDQHTINAITGLNDVLNEKADIFNFEWN